MTQSKKMDSKAFAREQATNIAKETVKQIITDALISFKNSEDQKNEKVVLNKKQICAGIQFSEMLYYPYLKDLDPDSEEAIYALKFINSCDRMNKMFWALMGDDDKINIPLEIPDLSEEEEWS